MEPQGLTGRGAAAIATHVEAIDGGPPAHVYHPKAPHRFRGQGPLAQVTAHLLAEPDHWHLVTYGLTELTLKESDDPAVSGWGFELTIRIARPPAGAPRNGVTGDGMAADGVAADGMAGDGVAGDGVAAQDVAPSAPAGVDLEEPTWAVDLLTNLAAYVWSRRYPFEDGHHVDLGGPIRLDHDGQLTAAVVVTDPALGTLRGPFGTVEFLQVVGLTHDELELCRSWSTDGVVELLQARNPLLVTDVQRTSILDDPGVRAEAERRAAEEGSSLTELRVATLRWRTHWRGALTLLIGAGASSALGPALRRELIGEGASFRVLSEGVELLFSVAPECAWRVQDDLLEIDVPLDAVDVLASIFDGQPRQVRPPDWPKLTVRVVR